MHRILIVIEIKMTSIIYRPFIQYLNTTLLKLNTILYTDLYTVLIYIIHYIIYRHYTILNIIYSIIIIKSRFSLLLDYTYY